MFLKENYGILSMSILGSEALHILHFVWCLSFFYFYALKICSNFHFKGVFWAIWYPKGYLYTFLKNRLGKLKFEAFLLLCTFWKFEFLFSRLRKRLSLSYIIPAGLKIFPCTSILFPLAEGLDASQINSSQSLQGSFSLLEMISLAD